MRARLFSIGVMVTGGWLAAGVAWSAPGGLPRCQQELAVCTTDLETFEATAQAFPATGQTSCWDSAGDLVGSPADCVAGSTAHDGDVRAGAELSYTDNGDGTATDNNTGLMWTKQDDNDGDCGSLPGSLDIDCTFTWAEAFAFVTDLNTEPCLAGRCDWRLPNVKELQSIVNYEVPNNIMVLVPAVSAEFNNNCAAGCTVLDCSCTAASFYWTSTSFANDRDSAWSIDFREGFVDGRDKDYFTHVSGVRAVRGGL